MKRIILDNGAGGLAIDRYAPQKKSSDIAIIIFPGGAYVGLADNEGCEYAKFLSSIGINCFVVNYRVYPSRFPAQLIDARLAVRFVKHNAGKYGVDKNKVIVMGSSAGGHLAALASTYKGDISLDIEYFSEEDHRPNGQILCYPVISSDENISHRASFERLLGENYDRQKDNINPEKMVDENTPPAFIWHTATDEGVSVFNSIGYARALIKNKVGCELHIFPEGPHGLGLAKDDAAVSQWTLLLQNWLKNNY